MVTALGGALAESVMYDQLVNNWCEAKHGLKQMRRNIILHSAGRIRVGCIGVGHVGLAPGEGEQIVTDCLDGNLEAGPGVTGQVVGKILRAKYATEELQQDSGEKTNG